MGYTESTRAAQIAPPCTARFTAEFAGVKGVWAVRYRPEGLPWEPGFAYHAFLLLTVEGTTKVLQTGDELSEMRSSQVKPKG